MDIAVLGLGEAGGRYARDLAALGNEVVGFDPADSATPPGVRRRPSILEAVHEADLVISFTGARFSVGAASEAAPHLRDDAVFADFNTGSPAVKREIEALFASRGAAPADVAVLAPVPRAGARTPLLVSGTGSDDVVRFFRDQVGAEASITDGPMGAAASRKLLRSVFMKGLAAVVIEADEAGLRAESRDWIRAQMADEIGGDFVDRLLTGTREHAERRLHEMEDTAAFLADIGSPSDMTVATETWLTRLVAEKAHA